MDSAFSLTVWFKKKGRISLWSVVIHLCMCVFGIDLISLLSIQPHGLLGLIKIHGLPRTLDLHWGAAQRVSSVLTPGGDSVSQPEGHSVFVQKKGIVQATTVKLVFSGAELTSGCNYLCECAAVVASLSDKCSVTHRQCWGSCCSITSSMCCVNSPVLRMGIYSVLVHIFMSISTFVSTERCRKKNTFLCTYPSDLPSAATKH